MDAERHSLRFSEAYGQLRGLAHAAREGPPGALSEQVLQCIWYDQLFSDTGLCADDGQPLTVLSPGWWNRGEGPDFKGAQIEIGGALQTGDVEIHLDHAAWNQHGHHLDPRYNDVLLAVVLESARPARPPVTAAGRQVPSLLLERFLDEDISSIADRILMEDYPYRSEGSFGRCSEFAQACGAHGVTQLINMAGEWRMLSKARLLRERGERSGMAQALYESFLTACGYSHFKHHFRAIARQFHYERVRQLGREDPLLLEAAFLQMAGLLPNDLPSGTAAVPHFARLRALRRDRLPGLRSLPLTWHRVGLRPINNPERRLAGAARFLARTADHGLPQALETIWETESPPAQRRKAFEDLFPSPTGFWATHCTWTGKTLRSPSALLGTGRVRSIIGNVFVPAALALARQQKDRAREEAVFQFFAGMPKEPDNQIVRIMLPRLLGAGPAPRCDFRAQQGLLQLHQDWCASNPSCQDCSVVQFLTSSRESYPAAG